ncbi:MAG: hypothetical protein AVDCRST_MAG36-2807, partial [uncultured Nocardioidaceae bacterium]
GRLLWWSPVAVEPTPGRRSHHVESAVGTRRPGAGDPRPRGESRRRPRRRCV